MDFDDVDQLPEDQLGFSRLVEADHSQDVVMTDVASDQEESYAVLSVEHPHGNGFNDSGETSQRSQTQTRAHPQLQSGRKFIIGVDFGTTTSTIAFVRIDPGEQEDLISRQRIQCVDHYPDMPLGCQASAFEHNTVVPTELWYRTKPALAQRTHAAGNIFDSHLDEGYDSPLDDGGHMSEASASDHDSEALPALSTKTPPRQIPSWGYAVHQKIALPDEQGLEPIHMTRFKLLLDEKTDTPEFLKLRQRTLETLNALKAARATQGGRCETIDIIADYLEPLFKHARWCLINFHDLQDTDSIQFVLCVPAMWTEKACRIMQDAMMRAIQASQLGQLENGGIKDLFIVAEPEAAAAYALSDPRYKSRLYPGETVLVLDCGGGTVDAITYQLLETDPLRVREISKPKGLSCGASFLNEEFRNFLEDRLEEASIQTNTPLSKILDSTVIGWENGQKRKIDVTKKEQKIDSIHIPGLKRDDSRGFSSDSLPVHYLEMKGVFKGCLRKVAEFLRLQLQDAKEAHHGNGEARGFAVQKVILIGGFGDSPSLHHHLENVIATERNLLGQPIEFINPRHIDSAVARGAVLRALNKENGPERKSRTSYGIICSDPFDKDNPRHRGLRGTRNPVDGELYIMNTIHWKIQEVGIVLRSPASHGPLTITSRVT